MKVYLDPAELIEAALVGVMRRTKCIKEGSPHVYGADDSNAWQICVEGALYEMAAAKALGVYWASAHIKGGKDIIGYEVRGTHLENGRLICHDRDADDSRFLLVTSAMEKIKPEGDDDKKVKGFRSAFTLRGWMLGHDAKQKKYWYEGTGRHAYFVPQSELMPLEV